MATIYRCDRCGKEQITGLQLVRTQNSSGFSWELCIGCCHKLSEWVKKGNQNDKYEV